VPGDGVPPMARARVSIALETERKVPIPQAFDPRGR